MAEIRFRLFSVLREVTGSPEVTLHLNDDLTVAEALRTLFTKYEMPLRNRYSLAAGRDMLERLLPHLLIFVNETAIRPSLVPETRVKNGDTITVVEAIAGG